MTETQNNGDKRGTSDPSQHHVGTGPTRARLSPAATVISKWGRIPGHESLFSSIYDYFWKDYEPKDKPTSYGKSCSNPDLWWL